MQTLGANKRGNTATYIAMCLLVSAASSLFNPVLSLFFNTKLNFSPLQISIFFILLPIATIVIVQTVAKFSDMGLQRPSIICISAIFGILSSIVLYSYPSYIVLCTIGLICLGSYPVSFPQIFASAREYSVKYMGGSIMFATFLRSLASLSWVVGPPMAYALAIGVNFETLFIVTAAMFALVCIVSFFFLPNVLDKSITNKDNHIQWWKNRSVMMLCFSNAFLFTAFSAYITTMPLYVSQELHMSESLPGYILGLAAFIEIPLMFLAARMSKAIGLKPVVIIGAIGMPVFLIAFLYSSTAGQMLASTFFAALFIAFVASMGMVFFQELLPSIPGQATSLYINSSTAGQIAGGGLISLAESGSYVIIYQVGLVISAIGVIFLFFVKKPPRVKQQNTKGYNKGSYNQPIQRAIINKIIALCAL